MAAGTFRGGSHPFEGKELSMDKPTTVLLPKGEMVYPVSQHIGAPAKVIVEKGEHVLVGQKLAEAGGFVSACVISSVSGTVKSIEPRQMVNGSMVESVVVENDGAYETVPDFGKTRDVSKLSKEEIRNYVKEAGIVGMGGAGFPTHVKLTPKNENEIDYVIVNGSECEPYLTSDYRMMLEEPERLIGGLNVILRLFDHAKGVIAVEDNKPDVIAELRRIADNTELDPKDEVRVLQLKSRYPQGAEKVLVQACTGRKVPAGGLPADVGCLVMNIASVSFLASYMRTGMPLTKKRVTIDGSAIKEPRNVIVPIGTPIKDVIEFCGGYKSEPKKMLMGGPMMGIAIVSDELPILKQNNAILAFDENEAKMYETTDCIRCGRCVAACPMNLMPTKLEKAAQKKDVEALNALDVMTCMECGCCAFSCPAGRRLVQSIRMGKAYVRKAGKK